MSIGKMFETEEIAYYQIPSNSLYDTGGLV